MSARTISCAEFDQLLPQHSALESLLVDEVAWFANRSGNLLGVIARGEGASGWNYVVLKRDKNADYGVRKVMGDFFNLRAARVDLLLQMAEIQKSGRAESLAPRGGCR